MIILFSTVQEYNDYLSSHPATVSPLILPRCEIKDELSTHSSYTFRKDETRIEATGQTVLNHESRSHMTLPHYVRTLCQTEPGISWSKIQTLVWREYPHRNTQPALSNMKNRSGVYSVGRTDPGFEYRDGGYYCT